MILRRTQSLCPVCLRRLDAVYVRPEDAPEAVLLEKTCPEHGVFRVPVWRDGGPGPTADGPPQPTGVDLPAAPLTAASARSTPSTPAQACWK